MVYFVYVNRANAKEGGGYQMKKAIKVFAAILICWAAFVAVEAFRLIGSTDPSQYPLLSVGSLQIQDELAKYVSVGFSQEYHLTAGDTFLYGEFTVMGVRIARWEASFRGDFVF